MSCVQVPIQSIPGNECVGDSLLKINGNFDSLADTSCFLLSTVDSLDLRLTQVSAIAEAILGAGVIQISNGGTGETNAVAARLALGAGTVNSVNISTGTTGLIVQGGPITTTGEFTFGGTLNVGSGGTGTATALSATFFGGPVSGITNSPTFRKLQQSDLPLLNATTIFSSGIIPAQFLPPIEELGLGDLTGTVSANRVLAGPTSGIGTAPSFRALVAADIPNIPAEKITTGTLDLARLPFTPIQQGGGDLQGTNKLYIGYSAGGTGLPAHLRLQVGVTDFGGDWPLRLHANRITDGTIAAARLPDNIVLTTGTQTIGGTKSFSTTNGAIFNAGGATADIGRCTIRQGTATNAGFVEWFKADGTTRMGYMGYNNSNINIVCQDSTTLAVNAAGGLTCTGEVTAFFSDERLKNFTGKIANALKKVNTLNGYYFKENEKARSLGYNNDKIQVGISAQEVEKILPEIVSLAPIDSITNKNGEETSKTGENIKTVKYERLIPLLIEAIKELTQKVETLEKAQLDK